MRHVASLGLALAVSASAAVELPDVKQGQINGRVALLAMPAESVVSGAAGATHGPLLPVEGCEAHLTPVDELQRELVFPCGKWFQPAPGRYRIWLERPAQISEGYGLLFWDDEPFAGRGMAMIMGMQPAGRIALSTPLAAGQSFRFLHLNASNGRTLRPAFDRRVDQERARNGVALAAGPAVAGVFDDETGDAVALARPTSIRAGIKTTVTPKPPEAGADVFVALSRPRPGRLGQDEVRALLRLRDSTRAPDAFLASASTVFAVWYGVPSGTATLLVESSSLQLAPVALKLLEGKVRTVRAKLQPKPNVHVSVNGPEERLASLPLRLELRTYPENDLVAEQEAAVGVATTFAAVAARDHEVVLTVGEWQFRRRADATPGLDVDVVFELHPIIVSGVVRHGGRASPGAVVAFDAGRSWPFTTADDQGRYEMVLWEPGEYYVRIDIGDRRGPPLLDGLFEIRNSRSLDLDVPDTRFTVRVTDQQTGEAVVGAQVLAGSVYERESAQGRVLQTATTGEDGVAELPPMRRGSMTLVAKASGYMDSKVKRHTVVTDDDSTAFDIALERESDGTTVTIRRPDGVPASGASLWAFGRLGGQEAPLWTSRTEADGKVQIPKRLQNAFIVVSSANCAPAIRKVDSSEAAEWTLSLPAPLTVVGPKRSRLAVWIDGMRVTGLPLSLLANGMETTDEEGRWSAVLPPAPLRLLMFRSATLAAVESGAYDAAAKLYPYPWPRVIDLQPVD